MVSFHFQHQFEEIYSWGIMNTYRKVWQNLWENHHFLISFNSSRMAILMMKIRNAVGCQIIQRWENIILRSNETNVRSTTDFNYCVQAMYRRVNGWNLSKDMSRLFFSMPMFPLTLWNQLKNNEKAWNGKSWPIQYTL